MVGRLAAPKRGDYVIDVCAAPGGKSLHIADLLDGTGMVEARDLTFQKAELIEENIRRCGFENIRAVVMDALWEDEDSVEKADHPDRGPSLLWFGNSRKKTGHQTEYDPGEDEGAGGPPAPDSVRRVALCEARRAAHLQHLLRGFPGERGERPVVCRELPL